MEVPPDDELGAGVDPAAFPELPEEAASPPVLGGVAEEPSSAFLVGGLGEAYKSEYQPPPLRMKFVPPLMRRCADDCLHFGQSSTGGSVIL